MLRFTLIFSLFCSSAWAVFDQADLQTLIQESEAKDSDVLMVWQNGEMLYSKNTDETKQYSIQSVTKSLTALTMSCVLRGQREKLDEGNLFPDWQGTPKADITLRQLLSMSSGIIDPADPWGRGGDFYNHAASQPLTHAPGTTFSYANVSPMIVGKWMRDTTGKQFSAHAKRCYFDSLGISDWRIGKDRYGNEVVAGGVRILAPDLMKIGIMLAQQGTYEGQQLFTPEEVAGLLEDRVSDKTNYGLGFWKWGTKFYYAAGHLGQYLLVVPSENLVILRLRNRDNMQSTPDNVKNWFKELMPLVAKLIK